MTECIIDIETEGLEPWKDRIVCIGIKNVDSDEIIVFFNDDEEKMLKGFVKYFDLEHFNLILGYNLMFDVRYIFARCLKYGIKNKKFFQTQMKDIMRVLQNMEKYMGFNKPGKLDQWSECILGQRKIELSENSWEMYGKGKVKELIEYNKRDIELTSRLWERIKSVLY